MAWCRNPTGGTALGPDGVRPHVLVGGMVAGGPASSPDGWHGAGIREAARPQAMTGGTARAPAGGVLGFLGALFSGGNAIFAKISHRMELLFVHWHVNPAILHIGGFELRCYSLLFISGFILGW